MNKNMIFITVLSVALVFGLLIGVYYFTNAPEKPQLVPQAKVVNSSDHIKWSPEKKNILVEYSDLQCPACKNFYEIIKKDIEKNGQNQDIMKKITFVYRHFPLSQHRHAQEAAYFAEAASKQNKFFEVESALFESQSDWENLPSSTDYFMKIAQSVGLDTEKLKTDMNSKEVKDKIAADLSSGIQFGVSATPTFFFNGQKVNISSVEGFISLLKSAK